MRLGRPKKLSDAQLTEVTKTIKDVCALLPVNNSVLEVLINQKLGELCPGLSVSLEYIRLLMADLSNSVCKHIHKGDAKVSCCKQMSCRTYNRISHRRCAMCSTGITSPMTGCTTSMKKTFRVLPVSDHGWKPSGSSAVSIGDSTRTCTESLLMPFSAVGALDRPPSPQNLFCVLKHSLSRGQVLRFDNTAFGRGQVLRFETQPRQRSSFVGLLCLRLNTLSWYSLVLDSVLERVLKSAAC